MITNSFVWLIYFYKLFAQFSRYVSECALRGLNAQTKMPSAQSRSQRRIDSFFTKNTDENSTADIVASLLNDLIDDVVKKTRKHIICKTVTIESWKKSYPWLSVEVINEQFVLSWRTCKTYRKDSDSPWANSGCENLQKSALDRHLNSETHKGAVKKKTWHCYVMVIHLQILIPVT